MLAARRGKVKGDVSVDKKSTGRRGRGVNCVALCGELEAAAFS